MCREKVLKDNENTGVCVEAVERSVPFQRDPGFGMMN